MHRFVITFVITLMSISSISAYNILNVLSTDGTTTRVNLADYPKVIIKDGYLQFYNTEMRFIFTRSKVVSFTFSDNTGVADVNVDTKPAFTRQDNMLIFDNLKNDSSIMVYGIDGRIEMSQYASGDFSIDLGNFGAGIHVVNVNGISTKIIIK